MKKQQLELIEISESTETTETTESTETTMENKAMIEFNYIKYFTGVKKDLAVKNPKLVSLTLADLCRLAKINYAGEVDPVALFSKSYQLGSETGQATTGISVSKYKEKLTVCDPYGCLIPEAIINYLEVSHYANVSSIANISIGNISFNVPFYCTPLELSSNDDSEGGEGDKKERTRIDNDDFDNILSLAFNRKCFPIQCFELPEKKVFKVVNRIFFWDSEKNKEKILFTVEVEGEKTPLKLLINPERELVNTYLSEGQFKFKIEGTYEKKKEDKTYKNAKFIIL